MIKKLFLIGVILVTSFCIVGFASYSKSHYIVLTKENPIYVIKLPSNKTTGYSWSIEFYNKELLTLKEYKYIPEATDLLGAGGQELFEFQATENAIETAPHRTKIKLIYTRPWETQDKKPIQQKVFNVFIK